MNVPGDAYVMLIASLPDLGHLFQETQTPMSRLRLEERLALLEPRHARTLTAIESVLHWSRLSMEMNDVALVRDARSLLNSLDEPVLVEIVRYRLEIRELVAALRRRALDLDPLPRELDIKRWMLMVRQHWEEQDFGLSGIHPWIREAVQHLATGDSLALERQLLSLAWSHLSRAQVGHYFDFIAVVVYVLRWNIVARWSTMNVRSAQVRFAEMAAEALTGYAFFRRPAAVCGEEAAR